MERKQCEASNNFFLYWLCCYLKKGEHYKSVGEKNLIITENIWLPEWKKFKGQTRRSTQRFRIVVCLCVVLFYSQLLPWWFYLKSFLKKKNQLKHSLAQPKFVSFPLKTHCSGEPCLFNPDSQKAVDQRFHCMRTAEILAITQHQQMVNRALKIDDSATADGRLMRYFNCS